MIKIKNKKVVFSAILLSFILFGGQILYAYLEDKELEAIQTKYAQPYNDYIAYEFEDLEYIKKLTYEMVTSVQNSDSMCAAISVELEKACDDFLNKTHLYSVENTAFLADTHNEIIEAVKLIQDSCIIFYNTYQAVTINGSVSMENIQSMKKSSALMDEGGMKLLNSMKEIQIKAR